VVRSSILYLLLSIVMQLHGKKNKHDSLISTSVNFLI